MGPPDSWDPHWIKILLSASLLTLWSSPFAAQSTLDVSTTQRLLAKPTLSSSQLSATEHGAKVGFYCNTSDVDITIHWVFNNSALVVQERMQLSMGDRVLTVFTVHRNDSGTYQCKVRAALQVQSSDPVSLVVYHGPDPVDIKLNPSILNGEVAEVLEGSAVDFWVETQSYPSPGYFWILPNDSMVVPITRMFNIQSMSREHEGTYRCLVSNSVTQLSRLGAVKVRVLERLTKPLLVSSTPNPVENSSVSLTCQTAHKRAGVQWFLSGQSLLPCEHWVLAPDNRTLDIHSVGRNDTGPYECEVWHWGSQEKSGPFWLTVSYGPDGVDITRSGQHQEVIEATLNSSLTLHCQAESKPDPEYCWTTDHSGWVFVGQQLVIEVLTWEHQGIYNCTAFNHMTGLTRSALVRVKVIGSQSVLSAGAITGITIGILAAVTLAVGLGFFLFNRSSRRSSRKTAKDPIEETKRPKSEEQYSREDVPNWTGAEYINMAKPQERSRAKKVLPPAPPEQVYEVKPPSAVLRRYSHEPRTLPPKPRMHPLVATQPKGNVESDYEILVRRDPSIYSRIKPSA